MKRLIPWFLCLVLAVWCMALLIKVEKLRELSKAVSEESTDLGKTDTQSALAPPEPRTERDETAQPEGNELLRLRNEVSQLRRSKQELEATAKVQAEQLATAIASRQNAEAYARSKAGELSQSFPVKLGMIGAMFVLSSNNLAMVRGVSSNSPAGRAGIKPGDVILSVDGTNVFGMPLSQVIQAVRGDEGTQVALEVDDGTPGGRRQVLLTRERVDPDLIKVP
jgi:C-terminal processing protease CtpA/Prc